MPDNKTSGILPECIDKTTKSALVPGAKELGGYFADLIYLKTGNTRLEAAKRRAKHEHELELFKKQLADEIDSKPKEYLVEPNERIVEQAFREAQICVSEPTLREMFCHLIANAADSRYQSHIHPAFAVMLSQMTPLDAQNLEILSKASNLPVVNYKYNHPDDSFQIVFENCFLDNPLMSSEEELKLQSESLDSLKRQGLVEILYTQWLNDGQMYEKFRQTEIYKRCEKNVATPPSEGFQLPRDKDLVEKVDFQKGSVGLTPLGRAFIKVCMTD